MRVAADFPPTHTERTGKAVAEGRDGIANQETRQRTAGICRDVIDVFGELWIEGEIAARVLSLEETVLAPDEVAAGLEGVAAMRPLKGVFELVVVFLQDFREPILIPQGAVARNHDVRHAAGSLDFREY